MRAVTAATGVATALTVVLSACSGPPAAAPNGSTPTAAVPSDRGATTPTPATAPETTLSSTPAPATPATPGGEGINGATPADPARPSRGAVAPSVPGAPVRLEMPSIGFDRDISTLGLNARGEINPPAGVVQWYDRSVVPGKAGISVIAGHVMYDGPDVFYRLHELDKGDVVTIRYAGGASRRFRVYAEESVDKKALQRDARVWGTSTTPVVALITCDAASKVVGNHHVDNYVVWAAPV